MSTLRSKRLTADYQRLQEYVGRHPRLKLLAAEGDPPETYRIEYKIKSLRRTEERLEPIGLHVVEIQLPLDYPRMPPRCRMLSPVFHPNIAPHAICVGDHWSAGEPIASIVARIGEMLAYQSYNTKSPLNGEAARWVDENLDKLPLDCVSMLVEAPAPRTAPKGPAALPGWAEQAQSPSTLPGAEFFSTDDVPPPTDAPLPPDPEAAGASADVPEEISLSVRCEACEARYRVPASLRGKRIRCRKCQAILRIPL